MSDGNSKYHERLDDEEAARNKARLERKLAGLTTNRLSILEADLVWLGEWSEKAALTKAERIRIERIAKSLHYKNEG